MFYAKNHNGTVLGVFKTEAEAEAECKEYTFHTCNAAYVDTKEGD